MARTASVLVTAVALGFASLASPACMPDVQSTPPQSGSSTAKTVGTAVGTGINAVLTAAFPAAATIINAIWGARTTDKKTASQAQPPLNTLQKNSAAQLGQLSSDLDAVNTFLDDCVMADRSLIKIQAILSKKTTLTDAEKRDVQRNWNDASSRITELGTDAAKTTASAVSDEYIRRTLLAISETKFGDLKNIQTDLDAKPVDIDDLRDRLTDLEPKLAGVAAMSSDIIAQVSAGLHAAVKNMAPAEGVADDQETAFIKRIADSRDHYTKIIHEIYGVSPTGAK